MAFPSIRASIQSDATDVDVNNRVATHPTGLTVGDFMLLFICTFDATNHSITTPSGWTVTSTLNISTDRYLNIYQKVATSGDVSAGSTTVSFSRSVDKNAYALFALTGAPSTYEVSQVEAENFTPTALSTTLTVPVTVTPVTNDSLVFICFFAQDSSLAAALTANDYTTTPSSTLTERVDVGVRDGGSNGFSLFVATSQYTGLTQLTNYTTTVSEALAGLECMGALFLVNGTQNATVDISHIAITPAIESVTASQVNVSTNIGHLAVVPTINGISTQDSSIGQRWTPIDKS